MLRTQAVTIRIEDLGSIGIPRTLPTVTQHGARKNEYI